MQNSTKLFPNTAMLPSWIIYKLTIHYDEKLNSVKDFMWAPRDTFSSFLSKLIPIGNIT